MKRYLSILLIICLISLSLPAQVMAEESVSFTEVKCYTNTIRTNSMIAYGILSYINFRSNGSDVPFHNATITDIYINVQGNGSMHIDVYRTYLSEYENISLIAFEFMIEMDLIAQPVVGLNTSVALPYLNGETAFNGSILPWRPNLVLLITNLENYTISLEMTTITYWDVYFVDDVVSTTNETETIETIEPVDNETEIPTSITSNGVVGGDIPSIWTIIMGTIVIGEFVIMIILGRLIMCQRRDEG